MPVIAGQSIAGVLDGLLSSFGPLFADEVGTDDSPVLVCFGPPGAYQPSAIVAIMDVHTEITRPTMGTNRSREMAAAIDVVFSVYTPGDESAQKESTDCALLLLAVLEQHLRTAPNERLGGAARDAWVSAANPSGTVATDPDTGSPAGRVCTIEAVVTALIRY
jgi:hypothetical protein